MTDSQIIKNILDTLINRGIKTVSALAKDIDYDQGNLSRVFKGEKRITSGLREKLHTKYGIRHEYMLTGSGVIYPNSAKQEGNGIDLEKFELQKQLLEKERELIEKDRQLLQMERQLMELEKSKNISGEERLQKIEEEVSGLKVEMSDLKSLFYNEEDFKKSIKFLSKPLSEMSICVTDLEGKINFINGQFTKQTGYNEKDMFGRKPGHVLQRGNSDQPAIDQIRKALRSRQYFEGEVVNYNKAGKEIICKLIIAPAKGKGGKVDRFISLAVFSKSNVLKYN